MGKTESRPFPPRILAGTVEAVLSQLLALVQLSFALLLGGARTLGFLLRTPVDRVRVARQMLRRHRHQPARGEGCLKLASEGLHSIEPSFLDHPQTPPSGRGIVIYFTGTGETPHAPLAAYRRLIAAAGELPQLRHYVVEAPWSRGAYYGSTAFSSRIWEHVSPLVSREPGPFLLVGLSRGAVAALDTATRIAEEHSKVATVLAMSPPLKVPARLPDSIVQVAKLEPVLDRIAAWLPLAPQAVQRLVEAVVRRVHLLLTAVIHAELGMLADEDFCYAVRDMELRGPTESSARAVREFRLLVEAPDRELEHFVSRVAATAARTPRFFASLVWGQNDAWAPADACHARVEQALRREHTPADRVTLGMLPARGHGLFREHTESVEPLSTLLLRAEREGQARHRAQKTRADADRSLQQKLSEPPLGSPHD